MAVFKCIYPSFLLFSSVMLLSGCGGGSDGTASASTASNTQIITDPATLTTKVAGKWLYHHSKYNCTDSYEFNDDGTFKAESNEVTLSGTYSFESQGASKRPQLIMEINHQSGSVDCENVSEWVLGYALVPYIDFDTDNKLNWYETEDASTPLQTLARDNQILLPDEPLQVEIGTPLSVNLSSLYASQANFKLVNGPEGMVVSESGLLSWTPDFFMLADKASLTFTVAKDDAVDNLQGQIQINAPSKELMLTRTSYNAPRVDNGIWVGDFDGDNKNEILSVSGDIIALYSYENNTYVQKWVYPYSLENTNNLMRVAPFDMDKDGDLDILVMTSSAIYQILDEKTQATALITAEGSFQHFYVADTNLDGYAEIALVEDAAGHGTSGYMSLWDTHAETYVFQAAYSSEIDAIHIADLDADAALEIIFSNGYVYDGVSGENQWYYGEDFGHWISAGDFDGDNLNEIVASTRQQLSIFNPREKTLLHATPEPTSTSTYCSILVANLDGDSKDEILVDDCGDDLQQFSLQGDALSATTLTVDGKDSGAHHMAMGDPDSDNQQEIILASNWNARDGAFFNTVELQPSLSISFQSESVRTVEKLNAAGWGQISPGNQAAVYVAASSNNGGSGQRIVTINQQGEIAISDEIAPSFISSYDDNEATVTDYDNNGYLDIFINARSNNQRTMLVKEIDSFSTLWGSIDNADYTYIHDIEHADFNQDGYQDAILAEGAKLEITNLRNDTILASILMLGSILDVATYTSSEGKVYVAVSAFSYDEGSSSTRLYSYVNNSLSQEAITEDTCSKLSFTRDGQSIICAAYGGSGSRALKIYDTQLALQTTYEFEHKIKDLEITNTGNMAVLALETYGGYDDTLKTWTNDSAYLSLFSLNTGTVVWSTPSLLGRLVRDSMHFIENAGDPFLVFATDKAMYITK